MSKMSEIAMLLDDQAMELGFESYEEALAKGYEWVIDTRGNAILYKPSEELDKAHEAWLKERDEVLGGLTNLMVHNVYDYDIVIKAYKFIKEQCRD